MPLGEPGYNGGPARTPHLDAMSTAPGAMQLSRFYCGGAVCSPTRASHLTGRTPNRVCMWDWINLDTHMHLPGMLTQGGPQDWAARRTPGPLATRPFAPLAVPSAWRFLVSYPFHIAFACDDI